MLKLSVYKPLRMLPAAYRPLAAGMLIGLISLAVPLLRDLHWESAGLAALVAAIYAAMLSCGGKTGTFLILRRVTGLLIGWATPLLLFALATNCLSFDGIAYWLLGPFPSMLLGWTTGRLVARLQLRYRKSITLSILLLVAIVPTIIEFLSFPQLYFFNHVWSYWPGPIYDEVVGLDARLLAFRGITFFWVVTLWALPGFFIDKNSRWLTVLGVICLLFSYLHLSNWGLIAPEQRLQQALGAVHETEHFRIYHSAGAHDEKVVQAWGEMHEEHLLQISHMLDFNRSSYRRNKIHSYIYREPDQKKRLTGAGQTSYVPVWIAQDQTHISGNNLERVLKHELVHVVAKQFGNRFGASISIGLVEGLAVALTPDRYQSSIDQLVAARDQWHDAGELRRLFSPAGFYSVAGPISYIVSGSFVRYLIENYPVEKFKTAYRTGNIEKAYSPVTLEELAAAWHRHLATVDVDETARAHSEVLFSTPSIFDKDCPRVERKREFRELSAHRIKGAPTAAALPAGC